MIARFGDLELEDDYTHPAGMESNYNESAYYNFFGHGQPGGFMRIGNRPNEGYAEVSLCLYLPGGGVLFQFGRPGIANNGAFDAGGMRFEVLEPMRRLRTLYEGGVAYFADPEQLAEPGRAFRENPQRQVELDLVHTSVGPVYGTRSGNREIFDLPIARAHYEQHMRITGRLSVDGQVTVIDALGVRDHSWGPRYWQTTPYYRWLTCTFAPDFGIMVLENCQPDGRVTRQGVVVRGPEHLEWATRVELESQFQPGTHFHSGMTARMQFERNGPVIVEGNVESFVPLRNRRADMISQIGEGLTFYRCAGYTGYGISEYLAQVRQNPDA